MADVTSLRRTIRCGIQQEKKKLIARKSYVIDAKKCITSRMDRAKGFPRQG